MKNLRSLLAALTVATGPLSHAQQGKLNLNWRPDQLDLPPLRQHSAESNPLGKDFNYAKAFANLDIKVVKQDIKRALTTKQA